MNVVYPLTERQRSWFDNVMYSAAIAGLFFGLGIALEKWELTSHRYHAEGVKVVKKLDTYRYLLTFPQPTNLKPFRKQGTYEVWFCHTYRPCLVEGEVLTSLRWHDSNDCWDIEPFGLGYNPLQDEQGNDIDEKGKVVFDAIKDSCQ